MTTNRFLLRTIPNSTSKTNNSNNNLSQKYYVVYFTIKILSYIFDNNGDKWLPGTNVLMNGLVSFTITLESHQGILHFRRLGILLNWKHKCQIEVFDWLWCFSFIRLSTFKRCAFQKGVNDNTVNIAWKCLTKQKWAADDSRRNEHVIKRKPDTKIKFESSSKHFLSYN